MTIIEKAYAKINLYLDVTGRREDGFHDLLSVMHSVSLCDIVTLSYKSSDETALVISTNNSSLPIDETNIVYRAAIEYLNYFNIKARLSIDIEKNIPIGAGLGGGSSDAAATLRALNKIFKLGDNRDLRNIAEKIGSDVPFCLFGGLYLCSGRGEKLMKLENSLTTNYVIAIGQSRISTPKAYRDLDLRYNNFIDYKANELALAYRAMIVELANHDGEIIPLYNIFEQVVLLDEIKNIKENMIKNGAEYTLMSGSGPAVFGSFKNFDDASCACHSLKNNGFLAFVCSSVYPEADI